MNQEALPQVLVNPGASSNHSACYDWTAKGVCVTECHCQEEETSGFKFAQGVSIWTLLWGSGQKAE